jgi:hypothetical protein
MGIKVSHIFALCAIILESLLPIMMVNKSKIAIIFGAGAVENAWVPILKVFKFLMDCEVDIDGANCLFARYIYLLRAYSKFSDEKSVENLKIEIECNNTLKRIICDQLKQAQDSGFLTARKEFRKILNKFVFNDENNLFGLVSTNWDTVIDNEADEIVKQVYTDVKSSKCFHIHGSVETPDHLYLPSETSQENYRSTEENEKFGLNHYTTLKFLKEANQIILYGLSLDPLDAELSQILNSVFTTSDKLQEIIIINPDYVRVRNRVRFLFRPKYNFKIKCFIPENLDQEV